MQFNNSLFQSGLGLLAGSMPNSGFSPWAAGLQGAQSGMAQDRADADRKRWEALIAGQGQPPGGTTPNPATLTAGIPPINQSGGPMPAMGGGVPSSAALRARFAQPQQQPSFSGAAAPSAQPSVASTSRGQGLGSEYWREFGLRKPQNAPAGAPPALTAARGGPAGVQVAALGPMGSGGAAMGTGGGQVTLAPQGQPQQALGVSPGPGTGLQGLLASMDPQTRQMVAMLGPERGAPLLMSMMAQRNKTKAPPADVAEYQYAKANGFQGSYLDFQRELAQATATEKRAPLGAEVMQLTNALSTMPQDDPRRPALEARLTKLNTPSKGVNVQVGGSEVGTITPGYELITDPQTGARSMRPIAGGPVAAEQAQAEEQASERQQQKAGYADVVVQDIDNIDQLMQGSFFPSTGGFGAGLSFVPGTPQHDVANSLNTIKANIGFDRLQSMRESSPTGGALGQVSENENKLLQSTLGSVEQSQSEEQFRRNLERVREQFLDVIHGKGNRPQGGAGIRPGESDEEKAMIAKIPPANERNIGTWYQTPRGRALWTGEGWRLE